jgi:hypothetical protein
MSPTEEGPFDPDCVRKVAIGLGYSPNGSLINGVVSTWWTSGGNGTWNWGQIVGDIIAWKAKADDGSQSGPDRVTAIKYVYGIDVTFATPTCPSS